MEGNEFLELHKKGMDALGFWTEEYRTTVIKAIEQRYKTFIIRDYMVKDFIINADTVLVKWVKRLSPLSNEELIEEYNRTDAENVQHNN